MQEFYVTIDILNVWSMLQWTEMSLSEFAPLIYFFLVISLHYSK